MLPRNSTLGHFGSQKTLTGDQLNAQPTKHGLFHQRQTAALRLHRSAKHRFCTSVRAPGCGTIVLASWQKRPPFYSVALEGSCNKFERPGASNFTLPNRARLIFPSNNCSAVRGLRLVVSAAVPSTRLISPHLRSAHTDRLFAMSEGRQTKPSCRRFSLQANHGRRRCRSRGSWDLPVG